LPSIRFLIAISAEVVIEGAICVGCF
jgi:hypothetical protein